MNVQEIERVSVTTLKEAETFTIVTQEDAELAVSFLQTIKKRKKLVEETFDPIVEANHAAWKTALAQRAQHMLPLTGAEQSIKQKYGAFISEEERKRTLALKAAEDAARRIEEDKRLKDAAELQDAGESEAAENLLVQPIIVAVEAPAAVIKIAGASARTDYDFEIVNAALLPREYLIPDSVAIRKVVKALKDKTNIPGIRVVTSKIVSTR